MPYQAIPTNHLILDCGYGQSASRPAQPMVIALSESQNLTLVVAVLLVAGLSATALAIAAFVREYKRFAEIRARLATAAELVEQMEAKMQANPSVTETPKLFIAATNYVKAVTALTTECRKAVSLATPLASAVIPLAIAAVLVALDLFV